MKIESAIEACDWVAVHRIAAQLEEIAQRGLYHASREKLAETTAFAMRGHAETDQR